MFDLVALLVLLLALWRSLRRGFAIGILAAITSIALLVFTAALALSGDVGHGSAPIGMAIPFTGPSFLLQDEEGVVGLLVSPFGLGSLMTGLAGVAAWRASVLGEDLPPEGDTARAYASITGTFIGAATFSAIRLVVALLFAVVAKEP